MASKAKIIRSAESTQPETVVEEREALPDSARKQEIRIRAHEIYIERDGQPGDALSDWLQAERELESKTRSNS